MAAISGMERQVKNATRALIVGLIVLASAAAGKKAMATQPAQTAVMECCGDPPPCPGSSMCPVQ